MNGSCCYFLISECVGAEPLWGLGWQWGVPETVGTTVTSLEFFLSGSLCSRQFWKSLPLGRVTMGKTTGYISLEVLNLAPKAGLLAVLQLFQRATPGKVLPNFPALHAWY